MRSSPGKRQYTETLQVANIECRHSRRGRRLSCGNPLGLQKKSLLSSPLPAFTRSLMSCSAAIHAAAHIKAIAHVNLFAARKNVELVS
jgi:hypothetical protein